MKFIPQRWLVVCLAIFLAAVVQGQGSAPTVGAAVFASSGCVHCHGPAGEGTDSGPSLRGVRTKLKPKQIKRQIVMGGGQMPAFGTTLNSQQVRDLVAFLRAKKWIDLPASSQP